MTLDLLKNLIILQGLLIGLSAIFSLFFSKQKNFVLFLFFSIYLLLIWGQNLWLAEKFIDDDYFTHYYQYRIDISSLYFASYLSFLSIFIIISMNFMNSYIFTQKKQFQPIFISPKNNSRWLVNFISLLSVCFGGIFLIYLLGGVNSALTNPGQIVEGQAAALFLILIGKFPLLLRVYQKQKISTLEYLLFFSSFFLTLINSRFLSIFLAVQYLVLIHYRIKTISIKNAIYSFVGFTLLIFVFGIYRDSGNYVNSSDERIESIITRVLDVNSTIDWFYNTNIEGFLGLSGILSYHAEHKNFGYDYGLTNFAFVGNLIPKSIQSVFGIDQVLFQLRNLYPYPNYTVVPSGLEVAYASFGVFGIIILSIFMGFCISYFDFVLKKSSNQGNLLSFFLVLILTPHMLGLLRTSPGISFFFALPDFMICLFYLKVQNISSSLNSFAQSYSIK